MPDEKNWRRALALIKTPKYAAIVKRIGGKEGRERALRRILKDLNSK